MRTCRSGYAHLADLLPRTGAGSVSEETKRAFVAEVERVGRDPVYWVRREASFAVGALAKVVPEEVVISSLVRRDAVRLCGGCADVVGCTLVAAAVRGALPGRDMARPSFGSIRPSCDSL